MDEEQREAQNLARDDLLAKLENGRPAGLARAAFVEIRPPTGMAMISVRGCSFAPADTRGIELPGMLPRSGA